MKAKNVNLLFAFVATLLFCFSCFCISKMNQTSSQLINCRNHVLEFRKNMLRLKNESENHRQNLLQVLNQVKYEIAQTANASGDFLERKVSRLSENEIRPNGFEGLKFFLPHLRTVERIYPDIATGRGKAGVSFALGITTIGRRNHTYLKQTLTSILSRMTPEEEKDSVVIISVADTGDYLNYVVDMVKTKFKRQVQSGSLEVISIPTFFYPSVLLGKKTTEDSESWQMKQTLDFCVLMLYARPKATYYLQLEDDIIARKMYFTKMKDFVNSLTSENWFYIEFSVLGFIGKLFHSKDLLDFVHFFLMFYKVKPIDMLLDDIFLVKKCNWGEHIRSCMQRRKEVRVQYRPSLFQHVGIHSSFPGRKQHLKDFPKSHNFFKNYQTHFWGKGTARIRFSPIILDKRLHYTVLIRPSVAKNIEDNKHTRRSYGMPDPLISRFLMVPFRKQKKGIDKLSRKGKGCAHSA